MDNEGNEFLVVQGKFLTGYLNRRFIWGTENLNSTSELAIRTLINNNATNPSDTDRKLSLMALVRSRDILKQLTCRQAMRIY